MMESEQIFSLRCQQNRRRAQGSPQTCFLANDPPSSFGLRHGLPSRSSEGSEGWWSRTGSNRRPPACKAGALPAELRPLMPPQRGMVGLGGLEPPTSRLSSARSNQLSYKPSAQAQMAIASRRSLARPTGRRGSCRALAERQHPARDAVRRASANPKSFAKKEKRRRQIRFVLSDAKSDCSLRLVPREPKGRGSSSERPIRVHP
jgi:hypothetical protein